MYHHVATPVPHTLLFTDWEAAAALWDDLSRHLDGVVALVAQPHRVDVLTRRPQRDALVEAARAFARWRCWHRPGQSPAPTWTPVPAPTRLLGVVEATRARRDLHRAPARDGLARDPLAWPFSTLRDALGLSAESVLDAAAAEDMPPALSLCAPPPATVPGPYPRFDALVRAVSEWRRVPLDGLLDRPHDRRAFLSAARTLTEWPLAHAARHCRVHRSTASRAPELSQADARALSRLLVDPRTPGLASADLRLLCRPRRPRRRLAQVRPVVTAQPAPMY